MSTSKLNYCAAITTAICSLYSSPAVSVIFTWSSPASGQWSELSNWSPAGIPDSPTDHAVINSNGTYTVSVNSAISVGKLEVGNVSGDVSLQISDNLSIVTDGGLDGSLSSTDTINVVFPGVVSVEGSVAVARMVVEGGTCTFDGDLVLNSDDDFSLIGSTGGQVTTNGIITWSGTGDLLFSDSGSHEWRNTGIFNRIQPMAGVGVMQLDAGAFINEGTFSKSGAFDFNITGNGSTLTNTGLIEVNEGRLAIAAALIFNNNGSILLSNGGVFDANRPLIVADSTLGGTGTIAGGAEVSGGSIEPGNSAGLLTIDGDLTIDGTEIVMELGGLTAGTEHDALNVTGAVSLENGATVHVHLVENFAPALDDSFIIFTASSGLDSESFEFDFSTACGNSAWTVQQTPVAIEITRVNPEFLTDGFEELDPQCWP